MSMPHSLQHLLEGFSEFRAARFLQDPEALERLSRGQSPSVLVVACSDSRVDPAVLTQSGPGEMFVVRNVAAMVPPYEPDGRYHGTSAALEFGVCSLKVRDLVVLGHALCGGAQALREGANDCSCDDASSASTSFVKAWMALGRDVRDAVIEMVPDGEARARILEQALVMKSLANLLTFPWIRERVEQGDLCLHGWYFDLAAGMLMGFDSNEMRFVPQHPGEPFPTGLARNIDCLEDFGQAVRRLIRASLASGGKAA